MCNTDHQLYSNLTEDCERLRNSWRDSETVDASVMRFTLTIPKKHIYAKIVASRSIRVFVIYSKFFYKRKHTYKDGQTYGLLG